MSEPRRRGYRLRASLDDSGSLRYLGFVVLAGVMSGAIPLLLLAQVTDVGRSSAWAITLGILVYAGVRLSAVIAAGRPLLFDFFFYVFVYVFMGIAPTVQIRTGLISRTTQGIDVGLDVPTALLVCLGLVAYEVGRVIDFAQERSERRRPAFARTSASRTSASRTSASRTSASLAVPASSAIVTAPPPNRARSVLLVVAGVILSGYFVSRVGVSSLFGSRELAFATRSAAWPDPAVRSIFYALAIYPLLVGIGALSQLRRAVAGASRAWYTVAILAAVGLLLLIVNPISSARYSLGTVLFALVVYAGAVATPTRVRATLIGTVVGLIFLFPLADAFRNPEVNFSREGFFGEYMGNPDYDAFWQIANSYSYVIDGLVQPLRQLLGSALFWVPRVFWPDKPVDTGILLAQYRGYTFDNLSAPLWAELLVNGGIPVLVIGFVITGFALRRMDRRLLPAFSAAGYWAIVGAIFPVYMTILLRGSLLQATGDVFIATACLLFVRSARARHIADVTEFTPDAEFKPGRAVPARR